MNIIKEKIYYLSFAFVRLIVELSEQKEKHNGMHPNPPNERLWIIAVNKEKLKSMNHDKNELNHL